jgi:hypothetical protein
MPDARGFKLRRGAARVAVRSAEAAEGTEESGLKAENIRLRGEEPWSVLLSVVPTAIVPWRDCGQPVRLGNSSDAIASNRCIVSMNSAVVINGPS